jgi:hypothetical protein
MMDVQQTLLSDDETSKRAIPDPSEIEITAPPSYFTKDNSSFALISFHALDRIRLTQLPDDDVARIREYVVANWTPGLQHCKPYDASIELKVKSFLWSANCVGQPAVTRLVQGLLAEVYQMGWIAEQGVVICKKADQKGR